jgi:heparan-alpha-glucosaminide N-acetyltransferase
VVSIDIFRGLNVLMMIFVDNLGLVAGLPWWTNHMPRDVNGMTYVDMVFPLFLFLMGMSIPLSLDARLARGQTKSQLWVHVITRSLTLVAMGLFVANAPEVNAKYTGMSEPWWAGLGFVAIAVMLLRWPGVNRHKKLLLAFRCAGLALLVLLFVMFRRVTAQGEEAGLDFSDWEILGLLGWAYLLASAFYLLLGKRIGAFFGAFVALVSVNAFSVAGWLRWIENWPPYFKPFEAGLASLTLAGVLGALVIVDGKLGETLSAKGKWILTAAVLALIAGWLLRPLGISKIRDTPTWCLYCIAANLAIALGLYWISDVKGWTKWSRFILPVGQNALLAYFLPYVAYLIPKVYSLTADGTTGWHGVAWSAAFAVTVGALVVVVTQKGVRLRV